MKKILLTASALLIGSVAFSQAKRDVVLQQKTVQDPKKTEVRVVKPKETVKKTEPTQKAATRKEVVANPPREEKKNK